MKRLRTIATMIVTIASIATTPSQQPLYGRSTQPNMPAVTGVFGGTTGTGYGIYGVSLSSQGYAGYFRGRGYFASNVGIGVLPEAELLRVGGDTAITGSLSLGGALRVSGNSIITGSLQVSAPTILGNALTVAGSARFDRGVLINNNSNLAVTGATTLNTLTVNNATVLNTTLTVGQQAVFGGDVRIGNGTPRNLSVSGNAAISSALTVNGATQLNNTLTVAGASQFNQNVTIGASGATRTLTVNGAANVSGNATIGGNLTVNGTTNLGTVNLTNLTVSGATQLNTLTASGATQLNNTLTVAGASQFNQNVTVGADTDPRNLTINGNVTLSSNGALVVSGAGLGTATAAFIHEHSGEPSNATVLEAHPWLRGESNPAASGAILIVTYNGSSGALLPGSYGVRYDSDTERWLIYLLDSEQQIPTGATFNVLIILPTPPPSQ